MRFTVSSLMKGFLSPRSRARHGLDVFKIEPLGSMSAGGNCESLDIWRSDLGIMSIIGALAGSASNALQMVHLSRKRSSRRVVDKKKKQEKSEKKTKAEHIKKEEKQKDKKPT